jgi:hypothetical protein
MCASRQAAVPPSVSLQKLLTSFFWNAVCRSLVLLERPMLGTYAPP